ncbi:hypothetical protein [Thermogymnomonas acidicola]|uniref:hypothetical protein n=1 Tax=Thermogymnomonas acidicola TaxID=399579 RepID=UPI001493F1CE|nr:hypothetical protein [Thermogymnomonas acidicola]
MVAVSLAIAIGSRFYLPESERWAYLNRNGEGERPMNWLTFAALSLFAITIIVGFPLTALVIGPFQFPQYTDTFEFLVTLAESVTGVVFGLLLAERISRKSGSLIAYTGGFVSILLIVLFLRSLTLALFLVILVVNGVFGEIGWAEREMLEPESFFTPRRGGRAIGYVRMVGYAVYVVTIPLLARQVSSSTSCSPVPSSSSVSLALSSTSWVAGKREALAWSDVIWEGGLCSTLSRRVSVGGKGSSGR